MFPYHIRRFKSSDLEWLVAAHDRIYRQEFGFNHEFAAHIHRRANELLSCNDGFTALWIAEQDDLPVGSIAISRQSNGVGFLNFVLVLEQCRGDGLAAQLLRHSIQHARQMQMDSVRLETYDCLVAARRLYQRLGFTLSGKPEKMQRFGKELHREFWQLDLYGS